MTAHSNISHLGSSFLGLVGITHKTYNKPYPGEDTLRSIFSWVRHEGARCSRVQVPPGKLSVRRVEGASCKFGETSVSGDDGLKRAIPIRKWNINTYNHFASGHRIRKRKHR
jgi:hypothetical protein